MAARARATWAALLLAGLLVAACFDGAETRGLPCMGAEQCGIGLACISGYCGGVFMCDSGETLVAASACDQTFDCPAGEDELVCPFTACTSNADCGPDFKCSWGLCAALVGSVPLGGECHFNEWYSDDCDADTACRDGVCVTDCQTSGECGIAQACNPETMLCEAGCDPIANNCPAGLGCQWYDIEQVFWCTEGVGIGEPCNMEACETGVCLVASSYQGCSGVACCAPFCDLATGIPCEAPNSICYEVDVLEGAGGIGACAS